VNGRYRIYPVGSDQVWKASGRLADGREIIYFDESPGTGRAAVPDRRDLPPASQAAGTSSLRWDALSGEWVIVAAQRQDRTFLPPAEQCPLCPSRDGRLTEIPADGYDVVVFENRFPSLRGLPPAGPAGPAGPVASQAVPAGSSGGPPATAGGSREAPGWPRAGTGGPPSAGGPPETAGVPGRPGYGRCEVVCFTSDHNASFASLSPSRVATVLEAWADRTAELSAMPGIEQVYCFENRGEEIGVTLHHPHGQIYGFPFVTPRTSRMLSQARAYAAAGRGNLFDDLVAGEAAAGTRVVARNEHWIAFVPAAARWPYEVLLFPTRRVATLPALPGLARYSFPGIYLDLLRKFDGLFGAPMPYIAAWHQAPGGDGFALREFALHLQLFTIKRAPAKLKYLAGTESGMGVWVSDVLPEDAARQLRRVRA
jgi:UDPglucose--hexose-1-phosphate uridylyltransferase